MDNMRPTWAEIDLGAIRRNLSKIQQLLTPGTSMMAVVKANAYGHGMLEVARACLEAGAECLAVATLDEAITLREAGIQAPVLTLGHTPENYAAAVVEYDIDATVFSFNAAMALSQEACKQNKIVNIHIKLDTGMGRIGFHPDESSVETIVRIHSLAGIHIRGIFSHFSTADQQDKGYTLQQLEQFSDFILQLERAGVRIPIKHIANSAAIMELPDSHFNMVRAGIITYGLYPSDEIDKDKLLLEPAMRFLTRISYLKTIPAGTSVSYGRTFTSQREIRLATVPVGYADGYSRLLSNRAWASIKGHRVPQVGRVCMDQCMFDVTNVENIQEGDEVVLFGKSEEGITADDLAALIGTINYEIVCSPGIRVPRIYIR